MINHPDIGNCLQFKEQKFLIEFESELLNPVLYQQMRLFASMFYQDYGFPIVVTSVIREDNTDHANGKAIDIRCKHFAPQVVTGILNYWHTRFPRHEQITKHGVTYTARSALAHDSGQGYHIHLSID